MSLETMRRIMRWLSVACLILGFVQFCGGAFVQHPGGPPDLGPLLHPSFQKFRDNIGAVNFCYGSAAGGSTWYPKSGPVFESGQFFSGMTCGRVAWIDINSYYYTHPYEGEDPTVQLMACFRGTVVSNRLIVQGAILDSEGTALVTSNVPRIEQEAWLAKFNLTPCQPLSKLLLKQSAATAWAASIIGISIPDFVSYGDGFVPPDGLAVPELIPVPATLSPALAQLNAEISQLPAYGSDSAPLIPWWVSPLLLGVGVLLLVMSFAGGGQRRGGFAELAAGA